MGVHRGENGHFSPLEIGLRTKYFWKKLKSTSSFQFFNLILAMTVFSLYETHTAQESGSQL